MIDSLKIPVILVLVLAAWQMVRIESGAVYNLLAERELTWSAGRSGSSAGALHNLHMAQRFDPGSPAIQLNLARVYLQDPGPAVQVNLQRALGHYRKALELRPEDAIVWARLFELKTRLTQYDEEWQMALVRALALGPWEPDVHFLVLASGIRSWLVLSPAMRDQIIDTAVRALSNASAWRRKSIQQLISDGRIDVLVCSEVRQRGEDVSICTP